MTENEFAEIVIKNQGVLCRSVALKPIFCRKNRLTLLQVAAFVTLK
jgi:hypothetical protein